MNSFGRGMLERWFLDPEITYLNHGTVGATPIHVLDAQRKVVERIERQPAQFMIRELANPHAEEWTRDEPPEMRRAASSIARYVAADPDGMVLVDNITSGVNAVVSSLARTGVLGQGDEVATTNLGYGGVTNAVEAWAVQAGAAVSAIDLPAPGAEPEKFVAAFKKQLKPGVKLAVIDHLAAFSAVVLPVAELVEVCRENGTMVLVDGAHVPGQLDLKVEEIGADWYVANLHKWAWVPRSAGFLWVAPEHREAIHSPIVSWGRGLGLAAEFDFPGTRDPSAFLSAGAAFWYRSSFGERAIRAYNHELAFSAAAMLSDRFGTEFTTPESMVGAMATVKLPERFGATDAKAEALRRFLLEEQKVEAPVFATPTTAYGTAPRGAAKPGLIVRICAQVYNELADYERLAEAVEAAPT